MNTGKGLKNIMPDAGIIKPLRQRIKDLEEINESHQNKNGKLRVEIQEKDKKIKELEAQKNNPLQKIREVGL